MTIPNQIPLPEAVELVNRFRSGSAIQGVMFPAAAIQAILAQPGCTGVRCYFARKVTGEPNLVLVGVDAQGDDMKAGVLLDDGLLCPPHCGKSPL